MEPQRQVSCKQDHGVCGPIIVTLLVHVVTLPLALWKPVGLLSSSQPSCNLWTSGPSLETPVPGAQTWLL